MPVVSSSPTAFEQQMLDYLNRARLDPSGMAETLIGQDGTGVSADIASAMSYFGVDTDALLSQLETADSVAPLAWNAELAAAARGHSQEMIDQDTQAHQLPDEDFLIDRVEAAGYTDWTSLRENIFAYANNPLHGHAGFFIDWGYDDADFDADDALHDDWKSRGDGIQDTMGHRSAILDGDLQEVGVGAIEVPDDGTERDVGPYSVTQDFGARSDYAAQLLGVAIADADGDGFYDMGEGLGGVTVTAIGDAGAFTTESWASGGYQLELPEGTYDVTFSGGELWSEVSYEVTMSGANVKLDGLAPGVALQGGASSEVLVGQGGADLLQGAGGDDLLLGDGIEPASVEALSGQIFRLYQATLDRVPDAAGHADWVTQLLAGETDLNGAVSGFTDSQEFRTAYGQQDDGGFVELLYENVLGRTASTQEVSNWTDRMDAGMTRAEVVLGFSESREFRNDTAAAATDFAEGHSPSIWTDDVYRLYLATLDREPDAAGLDGWIDRLGSGTDYQAAASGFTDGREFQKTYGEQDDRGFVGLLYENVLGREATEDEISAWTDRIDSGTSRTEVVEGFAQSREFVQDTAAALESFMRGLGTDDVLEGGAGNDQLSGGAHADVFVFRPGEGADRVIDFEAWDTLRFDGFGYADVSEALDLFAESDGTASFDDQGTHVTLDGVALAALEAGRIEII